MPSKRQRNGFRGPNPDVGKATQFKPGNKASPGRPREKLLTHALITELIGVDQKTGRTNAELIARKMVQRARAGSAKHVAMIFNRLEGRAPYDVNVNTGERRFNSREEIVAKINEILERQGKRVVDL